MHEMIIINKQQVMYINNNFHPINNMKFILSLLKEKAWIDVKREKECLVQKKISLLYPSNNSVFHIMLKKDLPFVTLSFPQLKSYAFRNSSQEFKWRPM